MKQTWWIMMGVGLLGSAVALGVGCGTDVTDTTTSTTSAGGNGGAGGEDCWYCGDGGGGNDGSGGKAGVGGATTGKTTSSSKSAGGGKGEAAPPCPDDFDPNAMCEGGPKDNYCMYMGALYYCENGSWKKYGK